jgi:hypothetical protein
MKISNTEFHENLTKRFVAALSQTDTVGRSGGLGLRQVPLFIFRKRLENRRDATQKKQRKYRAFHNVLQDYKNLLQENRGTCIYTKPVQIEGTTQK